MREIACCLTAFYSMDKDSIQKNIPFKVKSIIKTLKVFIIGLQEELLMIKYYIFGCKKQLPIQKVMMK